MNPVSIGRRAAACSCFDLAAKQIFVNANGLAAYYVLLGSSHWIDEDRCNRQANVISMPSLGKIGPADNDDSRYETDDRSNDGRQIIGSGNEQPDAYGGERQ